MQLSEEQIEKARSFLGKIVNQEQIASERIQIGLKEFDLSELDYFTILNVEEICSLFIEFIQQISDEEVAEYKTSGGSNYHIERL